MGDPSPLPADPASVMELTARLERDRHQSEEVLRQRDRAIGRKVQPLRLSPVRQVLAWLSLSPGGESPLAGERVRAALRLGNALLVLLGTVLGWLAAAAVFYYDGSRPVNVVHVLAVFVAAQILLLLLLVLTLLPRTLLGRIPGVRGLLETLDLFRPGRLQRLAFRWLPAQYRLKAEALLGASRAHRTLFGRLEKWFITVSSQLFALSFNAGALLGCSYLILFSDLAFAWSTTLQVTPSRVHSLTSLLSAPWRDLLHDAVPSLALIEASQYYRLQGGVLAEGGGGAAADPAVLGGWWPFLVVSMAAYGLLPRLGLLIFARWRLRAALDHTFLHLPGVADLLERMNSELVETQARDAEIAAVPATPPGGGEGRPLAPGSSCSVVNWGEVPLDGDAILRQAALAFGCHPSEVLSAGAPQSPEEDRVSIRKAAGPSGGGGVIVLVRAWEPPLEEFFDFLVELRSALPPAAPLIVAPAGMGEPAAPSPPEPFQLEIWRQKLGALGDPWLSVKPLVEAP